MAATRETSLRQVACIGSEDLVNSPEAVPFPLQAIAVKEHSTLSQVLVDKDKTFSVDVVHVTEQTSAESIEIQLRADKNLDPVTANALAAIVRATYTELSRQKARPVDED